MQQGTGRSGLPVLLSSGAYYLNNQFDDVQFTGLGVSGRGGRFW